MEFSNSPLISKSNLSSRNYNKRKYPISKITIHHAAGCMDMGTLLNFCANPGRDMSANYVLSGGMLGLCVEEKNRAWTSSNAENDHRAVTIEVSNSFADGDWPISDVDMQMLIKWCADVCIRNNIPRLYFDGTPNGTLTYHYMFANTSCPGPYIRSKTDYICNEVNKLIGTPDSVYSTSELSVLSPTAYDYALYGVTNVEPDYREISSYIITLDRNSPNVDFNRLKDIGVVAVLIEEGSLYDVTHKENSVYVSPKLDTQVRQAIEGKIPYGFFTDVKAQSIAEANRELSWLRIYTSKYVPPLGIWLNLHLTKSRSTNDSIIARYKEVLDAAGFHGKMGFYVTRQQLNQITWSKWKADFLLLLIDHINHISEIETLLTPEFFMLEKK